MPDSKEWLEPDGLGGFASGTTTTIRTRRYHALLLVSTAPPTARYVLVNGLDAWVKTAAGTFPLSSQMYMPGVTSPDGNQHTHSFESDPWPRWTFVLEDGTRIVHEIFVVHGSPVAALSWHVVDEVADRGNKEGNGGSHRGPVQLSVRPFLSGRDYHSLHQENPAFRFEAEVVGGKVTWRPYPSVPKIVALTNGAYEHNPEWYRNFLYQKERDRGLDYVEDLAAPGLFHFDLSNQDAVMILSTDQNYGRNLSAPAVFKQARSSELARRSQFTTRLHRSADAYITLRGNGKTIVAGYPWFTDWGRDTFIALRGLCLARGRLDDARAILLQWMGTISQGMIPNRFPDRGMQPEFNSVDASLWYIVAAREFLQAAKARRMKLHDTDEHDLQTAIQSILNAYVAGTEYGIRLDDDGLLAAGEPGVQLTWMDAKVNDWVVTPRIGKPVEVQALWLNALRFVSPSDKKWNALYERGLASFQARFWNESRGCLFDVVDEDHQKNQNDARLRPNQIFAVGGLPFPLLEGERARQVVDAVEAQFVTPLGLRSLAPGEPGYIARQEGDVRARAAAYHQGTVWPWLLGPFVEAWVRVRCSSTEVKRAARTQFLDPLLQHLDDAGLGHLPETADGEPPYAPRGCPFQAWSLAEALRLSLDVLDKNQAKP